MPTVCSVFALSFTPRRLRRSCPVRLLLLAVTLHHFEVPVILRRGRRSHRMFNLSTIKSSLHRKLFGSAGPSREPTPSSVDELKSRVAVRYFVKKSRRFSLLNQALQQKMKDVAAKIASRGRAAPDCLLYLGLVPHGERPRDREEKRKREIRKEEFQFPKPRLYECDYCPKIFFHKKLYRQHMIKHIKRVLRCNKCHTGFMSKLAKKKHQQICRR